MLKGMHLIALLGEIWQGRGKLTLSLQYLNYPASPRPPIAMALCTHIADRLSYISAKGISSIHALTLALFLFTQVAA